MKSLLSKKIILYYLLSLLPWGVFATEAHLNEGLPIMVDKNTELNDIRLGDMTVCYVYKLKDMTVDDALEEREKNKDFIQKHACNDIDIQVLLHKDLNVKFIYYLDEMEILSVKINRQLCQDLEQFTSFLHPRNEYLTV
ncbi:hypothetical protein [Legionella maceachernii]|uniref:Uncharacterized protein n=2 Tax=Legionella TaxID=445 RepID=A0A0W0WED5_9GAMM|nr:hypothetical protein [Legionella maceachernii]KTD30579.1 hypothetical protein Lmac_0523 [Legionella maceachernii]SJZ97471.1 hypothetical protein SAMN02745128_01612 [Legionella maceachernii]SUP01072.1 Uncharacterised protein [Legionella maceachernii]